MGWETVLPRSADLKDSVIQPCEQPSASPPVNQSSLSSNKNDNPTPMMINACGDIVSSWSHVSDSMSRVGAQGNNGVGPGAFHVGPGDDSGGDDTTQHIDNVNHQPDLAVVAHLVPDEAVVEAKITERLENEMNERLEERMRQSLIDSNNIVVVPEAKDAPSRRWNNRRSGIIAIVVFLVLGAVVAGVMYRLLQGNNDKEEKGLQTEDPEAGVSLAPSETPPFSFESLDPLVAELQFFIAPTEDDLLLFMDPTSPQSQALAWLQDDPITLTPGRLTQTALERYALAVLYYTTSGPSWNDFHLNRDGACTWNDGSGVYGVYCADVCEWNNGTREDGVTCSSVAGTVDYLIFWRNNLAGSIPWELVLLTNLVYLDLDENSLTGSIPTRINELTALELFWAVKNGLTGPLPPAISPAAWVIDLSENMLTGSFPESWWTTMTGLSDLRIDLNMLTGTLSTAIGLLPNMTVLSVYDNLMTGTLPSELGQLNWMSAMSIYGNSFTGSLNDTVCGLSELSILETDCDEVDCPCCTLCCYGEPYECEDTEV